MKRGLMWTLLGVFAVYFVWVFSMTVDPKLDLNGDNVHYIRLAHSLAEGHGYAYVNANGVETVANHFPPGYSAILSVFVRMGIDSLMAFKVINGIFLFISVVLLGFIVWQVTRQAYMAFAIGVLTVLSPQLMHFAGIVMSEMSYMLATVLTIFSLYMYDRKEVRRFYTSPWFYLAIVFACGSYYIRTIGVAAMFAVVVFFLFRKEWAGAVTSVAGIALCLLPWQLRNAAHGLKSRYLDTVMVVNPWRPEEGNISSMGEMVKKMVENVDETVIKGFKELLFPFMEIEAGEPSGFFAVVGGIIILGIVLWGAWNMGRLRWALIGFMVANIGVFALWHGGNGTRYVVPLVPYIFALFYSGIYFAVQRLTKSANSPWWRTEHGGGQPVLLTVLLMALPMIPPIQMQHKIVEQPYHPAYANYFNIAETMQKGVKRGTVVCCRKGELFGYFAPNVVTVNYKYSLDADEVIRDLVEKRTEYVVLEQLGYASTYRYLYPAITKNQELFRVVYHLPNPDTYLLKFDSEGARRKLGLM